MHNKAQNRKESRDEEKNNNKCAMHIYGIWYTNWMWTKR